MKSRSLFPLAVCVAAFSAATTVSHAATTIIDSTGMTPQQQAGFSTGVAGNLSTGAAWTFTTSTLGSDNILSSIGLEGRQATPNNSVLTLEIWSNPVNSSGTLDLANAVLIGTSTNSTGLTLNTVSDFFFNGITLQSNTVYTVHVVGTTPGFGLVGSTSTDLVADSRLFQNGGFVFGGTGTNGIDASFRVVTVPEPTVALLGGLGLLGLLRRRRA